MSSWIRAPGCGWTRGSVVWDFKQAKIIAQQIENPDVRRGVSLEGTGIQKPRRVDSLVANAMGVSMDEIVGPIPHSGGNLLIEVAVRGDEPAVPDLQPHQWVIDVQTEKFRVRRQYRRINIPQDHPNRESHQSIHHLLGTQIAQVKDQVHGRRHQDLEAL